MLRRPSALHAIAAGLIMVTACWIGVQLAPRILIDDAAISLRYAERLASGRGFTYNDDERVDGASNPLWTLAIAAGGTAGFRVEAVARAIAVGCFVSAVLISTWLVFRIAGLSGAVAVGVALASHVVWRAQALSGLEVPLAMVLGVAAVGAAWARREGLAGLLAGLAVLNKLDGLAVLVAMTIAWRLAYGRVPRRALAMAGLVVLPWIAFATVYFGAPWPHSLVVKLAQGQSGADRLWMLRFFVDDHGYLLWIAALLPWLAAPTLASEARCALSALAIWLGLHVAAYSLVPLGDAYPWYLGVPIVLSIVLAAAAFRGPVGVRIASGVLMLVVMLPHIRETNVRLGADRPPARRSSSTRTGGSPVSSSVSLRGQTRSWSRRLDGWRSKAGGRSSIPRASTPSRRGRPTTSSSAGRRGTGARTRRNRQRDMWRSRRSTARAERIQGQVGSWCSGARRRQARDRARARRMWT